MGTANSTAPDSTAEPTHEAKTRSNIPSDLPKLSAPDAKCPGVTRGNNPPAFNDGGQSLPVAMDVAAYQPSSAALKCAEARLVAGGFTLLAPEEQAYMGSTMVTGKYPGSTFHVIWAKAGNSADPNQVCRVPFTVLDYEGNINQWRDKDPMALALDGTSLVDPTLAKVVKSDGFLDQCVK